MVELRLEDIIQIQNLVSESLKIRASDVQTGLDRVDCENDDLLCRLR